MIRCPAALETLSETLVPQKSRLLLTLANSVVSLPVLQYWDTRIGANMYIDHSDSRLHMIERGCMRTRSGLRVLRNKKPTSPLEPAPLGIEPNTN